MIERIRTRAVWLAMGLVFGGGALAFAGVSNVGHVSHEKPTAPAVSESADAQDDTADDVEPKETAETADDDTGDDVGSQDRALNHGFYVSQAAQCEDVNDEANGVTATAPDDCETNGKAHGEYVSGVAKSDAGKGAKTHGPDDAGDDSGDDAG